MVVPLHARPARPVLQCGRAVAWAVGLALSACAPPPPSQFPDARSAIDRMRASQACSRGVQGEAKVDYFGGGGRVRGNTLFVAHRPESVRMDVYSPFGVTLSTLTSDGEHFAFFDLRDKQFFHGPANECNVRRFLNVPVPAHALVRLLSGEAPVLVHEAEDATIEWSGAYVLDIQSRHGASQRIRLEPRPEDWELPYERQRLRVLEVSVEQKGVLLYRVELEEHAPARTAEPRLDPLGIDPDVLPSGPECAAEIPRRIRFVTPVTDQDVVFAHKSIVHNPPIIDGLFRQSAPGGVTVRFARCDDTARPR